MNLLCWNIRGIGNKLSQQQLAYLKNVEKLDILAVLEPLVSLDSYFYLNRFKMDVVFANCSNKIWLFSSSSFSITVLVDNVHFLHCLVKSDQLPTDVLLTFVYAKCSRIDRLNLWNDLSSLPATDLPWMVGGGGGL